MAACAVEVGLGGALGTLDGAHLTQARVRPWVSVPEQSSDAQLHGHLSCASRPLQAWPTFPSAGCQPGRNPPMRSKRARVRPPPALRRACWAAGSCRAAFTPALCLLGCPQLFCRRFPAPHLLGCRPACKLARQPPQRLCACTLLHLLNPTLPAPPAIFVCSGKVPRAGRRPGPQGPEAVLGVQVKGCGSRGRRGGTCC